MPIRSPANRAVRQRLHIEMIEKSAIQTLELPVYSLSSGSADAPSAGTWNLYQSGSSTALVTKTCSVTVPPVNVSLGASDTSSLSLGEGYEQVWTLTYTDGTLTHRSNVVIVARRPFPTLIDADLYAVQPALATLYATGDTTWIDVAETAWWDLLRQLLNEGRRPWLVREPGAFHDCHLYLTLERIYRGFAASSRSESTYLQLADHYAAQFRNAMRQVQAEIDRSAEIGTEVQRDGARAPTVLCPVGRR